ncbi:MAG: Cardiolipin synthase [Candidatus Moranbacteria bacterium GW2011_GWE1_49_15]|nr:MAG: Cardiolipin synthase [Candidatus Moranbacteria bacterium GW2011_GWE1_49_15]
MRSKLYTKSTKAWDAMIKAIEAAEKSVYIEMYIFENDMAQKHDFWGKLKKKAAEGVRVVVVADAFGSSNLKNDTSRDIEKSGIEIIFFSHWIRRIHRKILIVDENIAFIGGVNIGKRFALWNDLQIRLQGKIAKRLLKSFAYTYEMAGGKDEKILDFRQRKISYKLKFWLVEHLPIRNIHTLRRAYEKKLTGTEKSIFVVTPYFAPPRWLISLLDDAVRRGARVEVLVPEKSDSPLADRINLHYMEKLHSLGIFFFLTKEMNHAKLLVIDEKEALVGSQNLDLLSFELNSEAGIFFKEKILVDEILEIYNNWKEDSTEFVSGQYEKKLTDYAIAALTGLFRPVL